MVEAYGGVVSHWRVHTTCDVIDQNNGAAKIRAITYFQAVDTWEYRGLNADYGASVNGRVVSNSTSGGINVGRNGQQNIAACEIWVNKGHGNTKIGYGGYINVHGYAGGSSSCNGSITIGGKPSYTVSYNANGGSGAPGSQTRWWGEVINLSNTKPTRKNYEFLGWSTSAGGGVNYPSGARYGEDRNRTLYAVWKLSLVAPSLTNVTSWRSDASGAPQNDGTYVTVKAAWSVDTKVDSNNSGMKMVVNDGVGDDTTTLSGTSGTYQKTFANKNAANSYTFTLTLVDKHMSVAATTMVGPAFFLLDINPTGTSIGIGQAAPASGLAVGGTYFATDVGQLPATPETVGARGTVAFIAGKRWEWDGSKWNKPIHRYWRGYAKRSDGNLLVNNGNTALMLTQNVDDSSGIKLTNVVGGTMLSGLTGDYHVTFGLQVDGNAAWMSVAALPKGNTIALNDNSTEISKTGGYAKLTLNTILRFPSPTDGVLFQLLSNVAQTMRRPGTIDIVEM